MKPKAFLQSAGECERVVGRGAAADSEQEFLHLRQAFFGWVDGNADRFRRLDAGTERAQGDDQVLQFHDALARSRADGTARQVAEKTFGWTSEDKVGLLAAATDDVVKKGVHAGKLVGEVAKLVGGGGGGKPTMAQAGGRDPAKLGEALEQGRRQIAGMLGAG